MDIYNSLKESGWYDGRKIDIGPFLEVFKIREFSFYNSHRAIFETYGDLNFLVDKNEIFGQMRVNLRVENYKPEQNQILEDFNRQSLSIANHFLGESISPLCLLTYAWNEEEIYDSDQVYIDADGIIFVFSEIGIYKFDNFLFKIFNQLEPEKIISDDEIDAIFFPNRGNDFESEEEEIARKNLSKAILEGNRLGF